MAASCRGNGVEASVQTAAKNSSRSSSPHLPLVYYWRVWSILSLFTSMVLAKQRFRDVAIQKG